MQTVLSQARAMELIRYEPETGEFWWRAEVGWWTKKPAGALNWKGYTVFRLDGKQYRAHRVAFLYMTGRWPENEIDHIDRVRSNNRWANLREATTSQNGANMRRRKDGLKGTHLLKRTGKFQSRIMKNRKQIFLGEFDTEIEAHQAYCAAATSLFGEFARFD